MMNLKDVKNIKKAIKMAVSKYSADPLSFNLKDLAEIVDECRRGDGASTETQPRPEPEGG